MYAIRSYYATDPLIKIYYQYSTAYTSPKYTRYFGTYGAVGDVCPNTDPPDTDGDGIGDSYDLKPNSSDSYSAAIISVCYDANNKVVYGVIQDSEGNP